jgi:hypothetical protein
LQEDGLLGKISAFRIPNILEEVAPVHELSDDKERGLAGAHAQQPDQSVHESILY